MPFTDDVNFEYCPGIEYRNITLKIFDLNGRLRVELNNLPSGTGVNSLKWRCSDLPGGNYVYKLTGEDYSGTESLIFTGRLIKLGE